VGIFPKSLYSLNHGARIGIIRQVENQNKARYRAPALAPWHKPIKASTLKPLQKHIPAKTAAPQLPTASRCPSATALCQQRHGGKKTVVKASQPENFIKPTKPRMITEPFS
jgi:hypothetical protein